jgi:peptide/nickel transport system permease protein
MYIVEAWRRSQYFRIGFSLMTLIVMIAVTQPWLNRLLIGDLNPMTMGSFEAYLPSSWDHWLGTDRWGRDVMAVLLEGLRHSMMIGALAGLIATSVSIVIGFVAGYKGGRLDALLRTGTDMVLVIPSFPLLVALAAFLPRVTIPTMALLLAAFSWPWAARTIRSQVMSLKQRPYVDLAITSDMNDAEIIFTEIMPNLMPYLGVGLSLSMAGAMLAEAGLALIGIGLGGGNISTLGQMIYLAQRWGALGLGKWQIVFPPIIVLVLIFVALNFINIGLEQAFNPRLRAVTGA